MSLRIDDDPEADTLAAELAEVSGEPVAVAVKRAMKERLQRLRRTPAGRRSIAAELNALAIATSRLPVYDSRSPDEIIGYDEYGVPS